VDATAPRLPLAATVVTDAPPRYAALSVQFAVTLFVSSLLCFLVQPMFGKMAVPLFGGAPAVWTTCVIFFQAALLAGYTYAHLLSSRLPPSWQAVLHTGLLAAAALSLPLALPDGWAPPADAHPVPTLLRLMVATVGVPFFVVSATAPLLQRWFAAATAGSNRDPYFLYAVSNLGSLLALISYPFIVEPWLPLGDQRLAWTGGYLALAVLMLGCMAALLARRPAADRRGTREAAADTASPPLAWRQKGRWLVLSFVPSSLMLAVTTHLSTDIAPAPLLWILPLTLYLVSFVCVFAPRLAHAAAYAQRAMPLLVLPLVLAMLVRLTGPLWMLVPMHLAVFFACALVLHGRLAADRPPVPQLTAFYVWIGVGGLLGGVLNTLVAPLLFTRIVEYPAALVLACLLRPTLPGDDARPLGAGDIAMPVTCGLVIAALLYGADAGMIPSAVFLPILGGLLVFCLSAWKRRLRFAAVVAAALCAAELVATFDRDLLASERTFFGVYRVTEQDGYRTLIHGTTVHGRQSVDPARQGEALTYFHAHGPIGQVFETLEPRLAGASIGVVGLGTGSLAAYARGDQRWSFYEIDPAVERIARNAEWFTYLRACDSRCEVVLGDARLSLAAFHGRHHLLVFDAFSSDAIPVHLLTAEALDLYLSKLAAGGVLAFHVSNRHLELQPVLARLATSRGLAWRAQLYRPTAADRDAGALPSQWVVMARSEEDLGPLGRDARWVGRDQPLGARVWTDDFSDIVGVLKFR
jgi:spermidine synthase